MVIRSQVYGTKLSVENMNKGGPIIQPFGIIVQPGKGWLEEVKSCTLKLSQCKGNLCIIISIQQIVMKIETAKEKKTGELTVFNYIILHIDYIHTQ